MEDHLPIAATDDLGRSLPTSEQTGTRIPSRKVGLFYFLWLGEHSGERRPLNVTKILQSNPQAGLMPSSSVWGGHGVMHHWGESIFGYYYSRDEWVMRRHIEMLTRADIDFLVFDTTNAVMYTTNACRMIRLLSEYRSEGWNTPQVVFYTNTESGRTAQLIYEVIYLETLCADSWYCLDGKPLLIAVEEECSPEVRSFFTIRKPQWPNEPKKQNGWPWMDFERPQRVFSNLRGEPEIINVSVAQHPQIMFGDSAMYGETGNRGRSYHHGAQDAAPDAYKYGHNLSEQWDRALETAPSHVFVTGWNEWIMGRWEGPPNRPIRFVDCATMEYSRDIEPMRGGYFDNYYMQLIRDVRRYKGTPPAVRQIRHLTASIEDSFDRFLQSEVVYRDFSHGGKPRNCEGYKTRYRNETGRNEIVECRAIHNEATLFFYARTSDPIQPCDHQGTWMTLFLNVSLQDGAYEGENNRWYGYNYLANGYPFCESITSLAHCTESVKALDPDTFVIFSQIRCKWEGCELMLEIPKDSVGLSDESRFRIEFKWADSKQEITRMEDFYTLGDAAPIGRLNYLFLGA